MHNSLVDKTIPPGKWWRVAKSICKFSNRSTSNIPIKLNGEILVHPVEKATAINDYFCSVSRCEIEPDLPDVPPLAPCELSDIVVTEQDVKDQLLILNTIKPAGPDELPPKFLKAIFQSLVKPLTIIFNKSLQSGVVPNDWKLANVSAVYKGKGESDDVTNYRPISVTNCFSKIFEKIIFKYIFNYIADFDILTDNQSGFRNKDSTVNQLLIIYDEIVRNLDKGMDVRFIFCDVSKAFDRVWHKGLLYKLKKYGIKGNLHRWFTSYLTDRRQRVVVDGCHSDWKTVDAGVPQGSVLGPFLFLLFINDIVDYVSNKIKLFADDTSLYCVVDDEQSAAESLNQDLDSLAQWASDWGVKFNESKTKSVYFTRKNNIDVTPLYMNNVQLENVSGHKHLGLFLSSDAKWSEHIQDIYSKACKRVNIMRYLKNKIDRKSLEKIYIGFIRPILEYGNIIWDNCTSEESELLESVQLEAARIITGLRKGTSRVKLYNELGWDTLQSRRHKSKLIFFHKALNGDLPSYISDLVMSHTNTNQHYQIRHQREFNVPLCRTESYKRSFFPCVLNEWNSLDDNIKNTPSNMGFKRKLNEDITPCPAYFYEGIRKYNIIHCQLRNEVSDLNHHLVLSHLSDSSRCACGDDIEDNFHFFYVCPRYIRQRYELFNTLRNYDNLCLDVLLNGIKHLDTDQNIHICLAVQKYIHDTKRFP